MNSPQYMLQPGSVAADEEIGAANAMAVSLNVAADLQDHLMTACSDLDRLHSLLGDAGDTLLRGFGDLADRIALYRQGPDPDQGDAAFNGVGDVLAEIVTALQFQDISSQLIQHTLKRLRNCSDQIASQVFPDDEDGTAVIEPEPLRPNPVAQTDVDDGSIELF